MNVQRRIEDMVSSGRISPDEGRELSRAAEPQGLRRSWLFDPFARLSTLAGVGLAAAVMLLQLALSRLGVRFDGALDMHLVAEQPPWGVALTDALVSWPLVALAVWLAALLAGKRPRMVDALWTVGVARSPLVLAAVVRPLVSDPEAFARAAAAGERPPVPWALLFILPLLCWFFFWLYRGYRTASGLSGARAGVSLVAALVVVELLSKAILAGLGAYAGH